MKKFRRFINRLRNDHSREASAVKKKQQDQSSDVIVPNAAVSLNPESSGENVPACKLPFLEEHMRRQRKRGRDTTTAGNQRATKRVAILERKEASVSFKCKLSRGKPCACQYCEKSFAYANARKTHERTHTGEKPYACQYCEKSFARASHRKIHERTHTGEKPYACQYCEKSFARASHRKIHERTHTGEKPYACQYCEKSFSDASHKKTHERSVHKGLL